MSIKQKCMFQWLVIWNLDGYQKLPFDPLYATQLNSLMMSAFAPSISKMLPWATWQFLYVLHLMPLDLPLKWSLNI